MPPTQCILSGGIRSTKLSRRPYVASTRCRSLGTRGTQGDPRDSRDPRDPRGPKGAFGALGGNGAMGPSRVIPKPFPMESRFEWRVITKENHSEMKAVAAFEDYAKE